MHNRVNERRNHIVTNAMDNFFQCCIILLKLKHWTNFWEYNFTFLTEKNWVLVFIILINWTELAFTSYENKKQKKLA